MTTQNKEALWTLTEIIASQLSDVEFLTFKSKESPLNVLMTLDGIKNTLAGLIRQLKGLPEPTPEPADF